MSRILKKIGATLGGIALLPLYGIGLLLGNVFAFIVDLLIGVVAAPFALLFFGVMILGERQEERILKHGTPEQKQQVYNARREAEREAMRPWGKSGGSY